MRKNILYIAIAALLFSSCASELDTDPAGNKVSDEQLQELVKKDPDLVLSPMLLGMIDYLHTGNRRSSTNDRGYMVWNFGMDLQGNDMVLTALSNWFADEYMFENLRQQTASLTADRWYCYYKMVYMANQILDLIPEDAEGAALVYKAQALTHRALAYYYLMNLYQDDYMHGGRDKAGVPYYTSAKEAVKIFDDAEYDVLKSVTDIDGAVANMVLARVALVTGNYTVAKNAAAAVIASGYTLMNEEEYTTSGFQSATLPETIYAYTWAMATSLENRSFASWISRTATDNANNKGIYVAIDNRLYDQIPTTDYRKKNFMAAAEGKYPAYTNLKFDTPTYRTDEIYMRLSEAYLLKAEAEARGGDDAAAQQTLFELVSNRDSAYAKSTKTGDALLAEIFLQSRIELWGEGHEYFTNKRFNVGVDRSSSTNHQHKAVIPAGKDFTYQIPLSIEINSNPNISSSDQNPL